MNLQKAENCLCCHYNLNVLYKTFRFDGQMAHGSKDRQISDGMGKYNWSTSGTGTRLKVVGIPTKIFAV